MFLFLLFVSLFFVLLFHCFVFALFVRFFFAFCLFICLVFFLFCSFFVFFLFLPFHCCASLNRFFVCVLLNLLLWCLLDFFCFCLFRCVFLLLLFVVALFPFFGQTIRDSLSGFLKTNQILGSSCHQLHLFRNLYRQGIGHLPLEQVKFGLPGGCSFW